MKRLTIGLLLLSCGVCAQQLPVGEHPVNVGLREGEPGGYPTGWTMFDPAVKAGFTAHLQRSCPKGFSACVIMQTPLKRTSNDGAGLFQSFAAGPYLGRRVRFSAWLASGEGHAAIHIRMRVDTVDGHRHFFDSTEPMVVTPEPQHREVTAYVGPDAATITIWARIVPDGSAWVFDPMFEVLEAPPHTEDESIRAFIKKFADTRNAHDGIGISELYAEDGEYLGIRTAQVRGRPALAKFWSGLVGRVERTIQSIDYQGGSLAIVHVQRQADGFSEQYPEIFVLVKENGSWTIRVHQSLI